MQKVLVVGGGLAGACVGYQLKEIGVHVVLIDSGVNVSSRVAAGMINPLVFRRMTKSWRLDEFLPFALDFYRDLEKKTNVNFLHEITIRRFFSSIQEREFWLDRQENPEFQNYMFPVSSEDETIFPYANEFGSGRVKNSYFLNTNLLIDTLIAKSGVELIRATFEYDHLDPEKGSYKGESYDRIIFCEGYQSKANPWFHYLPVDSTKGETLTVEATTLFEGESFNRKCFSLPLGNNQFRVGATYVWHTDNTELTTEGRELLLHNLSYLTEEKVKVVDQTAGVRPTTRDRRPFMGNHPEFQKLSVFNGLGAKGFMMAPLLTKELIDFLLFNKPLQKECGIERIKTN